MHVKRGEFGHLANHSSIKYLYQFNHYKNKTII